MREIHCLCILYCSASDELASNLIDREFEVFRHLATDKILGQKNNTFHILKGLLALHIFLGVCKKASIYLNPLEPFINFIWCQQAQGRPQVPSSKCMEVISFSLLSLIVVKPTSGVLFWLVPVLILSLCFGPMPLGQNWYFLQITYFQRHDLISLE